MPVKDKLNLGCGNDIRKNFVNLDREFREGVDVVHDINKFPWPFKENTFSYIVANHILEHTDNLIQIMEELHRISKNNALLEIKVPYFSHVDAIGDPTHKRFFSYKTFDFFVKKPGYKRTDWKPSFSYLSKKLIFTNNKFFNFLNFFPNLSPKLYERFFLYLFPCQELRIRLRVLK